MIPLIDMVKLVCLHKSKVIETMFYVVEGNAPPLISLQSSVGLGLIKLTYAIDSSPECFSYSKQLIKNDYSDVFKGIGVISGKVKLYLKGGAVPVVNPLRRIPEALKSKLKAELDKMVNDHIITLLQRSLSPMIG